MNSRNENSALKQKKIPKYLEIDVYLNASFAVVSLEKGIFGHQMGINESTLT